jgi:high-affinity iron transporter
MTTFVGAAARTRRALAAVALVAVAVVAAPARAEDPDFPALIRDAARDYPAPAARIAVGDAFFRFESSTVHGAIASREPALYRDVEVKWLALAAAMKGGEPADEVRAQAEALAALLEGAVGREAGATTSTSSLFVDSLLIILREGFEAILVLTALAAYLVRVGQPEKRWLIYAGGIAALVATAALALVAGRLIPMGGAAREALEGITMLLAVVVLFFASYWLISKAEARHWQAYVRSKLEDALGSERRAALVALAFLVVFREGFETVLFYQALVARAGGASLGVSAVGSGFLVGIVLLAGIAVALFRYGVRLPVGPFFLVTGILLYLLAFKFAGAGVRELQEAGWVSVTPVAIPDVPFLRDWLAIYPFAEPLAAQSVLIAFLLGGLVWVWLTRPAVEVARS